MRHVLVGIGLFLLQLCIVFKERDFAFNKYLNPIYLLVVSMALPVYLIWLHLKRPEVSVSQKLVRPWHRLIWALGGLITILLSYEELRKIFVHYNNPIEASDVIPQLSTLYERFSRGEFPYSPIHFATYDLMPIYMPLHWLPAGLATPLHLDIRWIGVIFLALSVAWYGWFMAVQPGRVGLRIMALVLPSLSLWAFIHWGAGDLGITYEIIIAAYYLVLSFGLFARKYWLVTIGIILCLLSRYTLLFWLPLFAFIYLKEKGLKKSLVLWGSVVAAIVLLFILPFYIKDPAFMSRGLSYYTIATVGDWIGCCADPPVSWTQENGISFAIHMKALFSGDMAHRVASNRIVLGIVLLLTFAGSLMGYLRWRHRIDPFTYSLVTLYTFICVYFLFCPLTYRYYLLPFLMVSAVLCGKILLYKQPELKLE
jgi:hypothetical protein